MTQALLDLYNSQLVAYNAALEAKIDAAPNKSERTRLESCKHLPVAAGELSDKELRTRLRVQRQRLGSVLKNRAVELLRHVVPDVLHLERYTVGLSYATIIGILRQEFPETNVSSACLRWYVSRITEFARDLGEPEIDLPQYRPRSRDTSYQPRPAFVPKDQESPVPPPVYQPLQALKRY